MAQALSLCSSTHKPRQLPSRLLRDVACGVKFYTQRELYDSPIPARYPTHKPSEHGVSGFGINPLPRAPIDDLSVEPLGENTFTLRWSYSYPGDSNLDGYVDIADLAPIAEHFLEVASPENEWIDGDNNGIIDIADVTAIGTFFFQRIAGYVVQLVEKMPPGLPAELHYIPPDMAKVKDNEGKMFGVELVIETPGFVRAVPVSPDGRELWVGYQWVPLPPQ